MLLSYIVWVTLYLWPYLNQYFTTATVHTIKTHNWEINLWVPYRNKKHNLFKVSSWNINYWNIKRKGMKIVMNYIETNATTIIYMALKFCNYLFVNIFSLKVRYETGSSSVSF